MGGMLEGGEEENNQKEREKRRENLEIPIDGFRNMN